MNNIIKKFDVHQYVIICLNTDYGIEVVTLTLLPLGADMNASVYKAETHDRRSYFVKLKQGHHDDISVDNIRFVTGIRHSTDYPPCQNNRWQLTQPINDFTLIVYPFVDGQNGFCRNLTDDQWVTLGNVLRQVHEIDVPPSIKERVRKEAYSSKWREIVRSLYMSIDEDWSIIDETALKLKAFMKEHRKAICRLVDRAECLSQKIQEESNRLNSCYAIPTFMGAMY